jgi:hypothetical protein
MSVYDKQYYQDNKDKFNQSRQRYRKSNLKRVPLDVSIGWYEALKAYCDANNLKVNSFIKAACEEIASKNGFTGFDDFYNEQKDADDDNAGSDV